MCPYKSVRINMSRKGQSITLSISERDKAELETLALEFGMKWGDKPNISRLVEAIARRQLLLGNNNDWTPSRIRALDRAMRGLIDMGQNEQAQEIGKLLLERSELSTPLRTQIEEFLGNPPPAWRLQVERYIKCQQSFQISYEDAAHRVWDFTVCHARITNHEKRQYLDCWCEETEGNQDIEELQHNWCLRLDRIQDAAVVEVDREWRSHLAEIEVEMRLHNGLAFAYQGKPEDVLVEWIPEKQRVKKVIRRVTSTFWFIREVMQYAPDCVVVTPNSVRDRIKAKIRTLSDLYEM